MVSFFNKAIHFGWNFSDKLSQKAARISAPLGTVSELTPLAVPILFSSQILSKISNPVFRFSYIITSTAAIAFFSAAMYGPSKKNWIKNQIKEICLKSKSEKNTRKLVYIASSYSDSKNLSADLFFNFRTKSDITRLAKNFEIKFVEAKSQSQLEKKISQLDDQDINAVIIQAHGNQPVIQFSRDYCINLNSLGIFETLAKKLKPGATISLISCFTGKGTENIAQKISILCSTATIFAPNEDYLIADHDSFKISDDGSCSFKSGNFITGLYENRRNTTTIYQNGQSLKIANG